MSAMPGYGDAATWGSCKGPRDPRHSPSSREDWEESTSFVDMLPESTINSILDRVLSRRYDIARLQLVQAIDAAWMHGSDHGRPERREG